MYITNKFKKKFTITKKISKLSFAISILPLAFFSNANANNLTEKIQCDVPENLMLSILLTEQTSKRSLNYPYIIRTNYSKKKNKMKFEMSTTILEHLGSEQISKNNSYSYDCKNLKQCIETVKYFRKYNMKNFDLGPFQTNLYFHPNDIEYFFNFNSSYNMACNFLTKLISNEGYSWNTIAKYHSRTEELNIAYQKKLKYNYNRVLQSSK